MQILTSHNADEGISYIDSVSSCIALMQVLSTSRHFLVKNVSYKKWQTFWNVKEMYKTGDVGARALSGFQIRRSRQIHPCPWSHIASQCDPKEEIKFICSYHLTFGIKSSTLKKKTRRDTAYVAVNFHPWVHLCIGAALTQFWPHHQNLTFEIPHLKGYRDWMAHNYFRADLMSHHKIFQP